MFVATIQNVIKTVWMVSHRCIQVDSESIHFVTYVLPKKNEWKKYTKFIIVLVVSFANFNTISQLVYPIVCVLFVQLKFSADLSHLKLMECSVKIFVTLKIGTRITERKKCDRSFSLYLPALSVCAFENINHVSEHFRKIIFFFFFFQQK